MKCVKLWAKGMCACFEEEYLRRPTQDDFLKQMNVNDEKGWPSMFGSIDCMHWWWRHASFPYNGVTKAMIKKIYDIGGSLWSIIMRVACFLGMHDGKNMILMDLIGPHWFGVC